MSLLHIYHCVIKRYLSEKNNDPCGSKSMSFFKMCVLKIYSLRFKHDKKYDS